eukprot:3560224-Pleurochrysis_carterae.AAC.1
MKNFETRSYRLLLKYCNIYKQLRINRSRLHKRECIRCEEICREGFKPAKPSFISGAVSVPRGREPET